MQNSTGAGWRMALRVVAVQAIAVLAASAVCLINGPSAALAALADQFAGAK